MYKDSPQTPGYGTLGARECDVAVKNNVVPQQIAMLMDRIETLHGRIDILTQRVAVALRSEPPSKIGTGANPTTGVALGDAIAQAIEKLVDATARLDNINDRLEL